MSNEEDFNRPTEDVTPFGVASLGYQRDPGKFIREIDGYLGHTFDEMTVIDETYGQLSTFFMEQTNEVVGDRDFFQLSQQEQNEAAIYMAAALAINGASAVTRGIKETIALEIHLMRRPTCLRPNSASSETYVSSSICFCG